MTPPSGDNLDVLDFHLNVTITFGLFDIYIRIAKYKIPTVERAGRSLRGARHGNSRTHIGRQQT